MALTKVTFSMIQDAFLNVKDFGAVGDGVTDDTAAIQAAFDAGTNIVFPTGTYVINGNTTTGEPITINTDKNVDLQGSVLLRTVDNGQGGFFKVTAGGDYFKLYNGTLNAQNNTFAFYHLIDFNAPDCDLHIENVTLLNNCEGGVAAPTQLQDNDLLYVYEAKSTRVINCNFNLAARQGISFINGCPYVEIQGSTFENCFLFGIDFEPNASPAATNDMFENVFINECVFKNNGNKYVGGSPVKVWPTSANGPMAIESPSDTTKGIIKNFSFTNNNIISLDFENVVAGQQSPSMRINSYKTAIITGNTFQNIAFLNVATTDASAPYLFTTISNNVVNQSFGDHPSTINCYHSDKLVVSNNTLSYLAVGAQDQYVVSGNNFSTTNAWGIEPRSGSANGVIASNTFDVATYAISTSASTTGYILVGNELNGATLTGPTAVFDVPRVGNSDGVVSAAQIFQGDYAFVNVPSGVTTTIADLTDTTRAGIVTVTDGGTRIGSFALYGNFTDGSNNTTYLTNVKDSGHHSSALTLSGQLLQFTHTFGSARNLRVNLGVFA